MIKFDSSGEVLPLVLRKPQVRKATGLSDRQIDRLEAQDGFPKRFKLNPAETSQQAAVGWSAAEVEKWLSERLASRDGMEPEAG